MSRVDFNGLQVFLYDWVLDFGWNLRPDDFYFLFFNFFGLLHALNVLLNILRRYFKGIGVQGFESFV